MEQLFNEIVLKDLDKVNELIRKGWYGTTDFNEAVLNLSNSLAVYHQEVTNEDYTKGERISEVKLARGA